MRQHVLLLGLISSIRGPALSQHPSVPVDRIPPVYLNHLYLVLDKPTYEDIGRSDFIRSQFAGFSRTTTVANGGESWTGTYIEGEHTYIELFAPAGDDKAGDAGIGLGVEQEGGVDLIYNHLNSLFGEKAKKKLKTRVIGEKEIPWFYTTRVYHEEGHSSFIAWVMEYHRDYWKRRLDAKPEENGITRKQMQLRDFKSDRYFQDIYEAKVALTDSQANELVEELKAFGFTIKAHGRNRECTGADIKIVIVPRTSSSVGITELKLRLLRPKEGQTVYKFGSKSVLKFDGKRARWTF